MTGSLSVRLWRAIAQAWRGDSAPARRSYAAAAPHRLTSDWAGTSQSADKATRYQAKPLRFRARELRENSGVVSRYAGLCRDNIIGPDGVTLQCVVPSTRGSNESAANDIEAAFYRWADACTPDGRSWVDVCKTLTESWRVEGEALLELIPSSAAPMGLWVRPLDADLLDDKKNQEKTPTGGTIVQGVEYDAAGRVIRYHVLTAHPGDGQVAQYRELPASRVIFLAHTARPQQTRGITPLAPVMGLIQHLEKTDEAIVVLNRVTASKMGALIPGPEATPLDGEDGTPPEIEQAPGEWWVLPKDWTVQMLDPGQPTQEYDVFAKHLLRKISSGLQVAYASLTGDLSDVNYSSMRAGLLVERDAWQGMQAAFIDVVVRPVFRLWLYTAELKGAITIPSGQSADSITQASAWHPRRWPWVDPLKDAQGIEVLLGLGLTTRTREANKQGLAFTDLLAEREREETAIQTSGITLSVTPAKAQANDPADQPAPPARSLRAVV